MHRVNPRRDAFADVWGLDGWFVSEDILVRMWALSRALVGKGAAHMGQSNFFVFFDKG